MKVLVQVERFYGFEELGEFETSNTEPADIAEDLCDYLLELYPDVIFSIVNIDAGKKYISVKIECNGSHNTQDYFILRF